jgi:hypothetical protein
VNFLIVSFLLSIMSLVPVPYQDNGCDCGIFVCRYAYNLYMMRHKRFTWDSYWNERPSFASLITSGSAFQFDVSNIGRIRDEISILIDNLSKLYLPRLEEQEKAAREAKRSSKQKESLYTYVPTLKDEGKADAVPPGCCTGRRGCSLCAKYPLPSPSTSCEHPWGGNPSNKMANEDHAESSSIMRCVRGGFAAKDRTIKQLRQDIVKKARTIKQLRQDMVEKDCTIEQLKRNIRPSRGGEDKTRLRSS